MACPGCEEAGCDLCDGRGYFDLTDCPQRYVGREMTEAINMAGMCGNGVWPGAGGILDQSAWFVDLFSVMEQEQSKIESMRNER